MGKDEPPWRGRPCRRVVKALALPLPLPRARRSNRRTAPFPPTSAISPPSPRGLIFTHIFSVISSFSKAIRALSLSVFNPCSIRGSGTLVAALPLWDIRGRLRLFVSQNDYLQHRHHCPKHLVREVVEFRQQRLTTDDPDFTDNETATGDEPPGTLPLTLASTAHPRSLHRLAVHGSSVNNLARRFSALTRGRPIQSTASWPSPLCDFAPLRLCVGTDAVKTQRRKDAKTQRRKASNRLALAAEPGAVGIE